MCVWLGGKPRVVRPTGELGPAGSWVVDRAHREAPQAVVVQLSEAHAEAQQDAIDLLLRWRLDREREEMRRL